MCNSVVKQEMCLSSAGELSLCVLMLITLLFAETASSLKLVCHRKAFQCLAFFFFFVHACDGDLFMTSKNAETELSKVITATCISSASASF